MNSIYLIFYFCLSIIIVSIYIISYFRENGLSKIYFYSIILLNLLKFLFSKYIVHQGKFLWSYDDRLARRITTDFYNQGNLFDMIFFSLTGKDQDGVLYHMLVALTMNVFNINIDQSILVLQIIINISLSVVVILISNFLITQSHNRRYAIIPIVYLFTDWPSFVTTDFRPENLSLLIVMIIILNLIKHYNDYEVDISTWIMLFILLFFTHFLTHLVVSIFMASFIYFAKNQIHSTFKSILPYYLISIHFLVPIFYRKIFLNWSYVLNTILGLGLNEFQRFIVGITIMIIYLIGIFIIYLKFPPLYDYLKNLIIRKHNEYHSGFYIYVISIVIVFLMILIAYPSYRNPGYVIGAIIDLLSYILKGIFLLLILNSVNNQLSTFETERVKLSQNLLLSSFFVLVILFPLSLLVRNLITRVFSIIFIQVLIYIYSNPSSIERINKVMFIEEPTKQEVIFVAITLVLIFTINLANYVSLFSSF